MQLLRWVSIQLKPKLLWMAPTNKDTQKKRTGNKAKLFEQYDQNIQHRKDCIPVVNLPWTAQCDWLHRLLTPNFDPGHVRGQQEPEIFEDIGVIVINHSGERKGYYFKQIRTWSSKFDHPPPEDICTKAYVILVSIAQWKSCSAASSAHTLWCLQVHSYGSSTFKRHNFNYSHHLVL